MKGISVVTCALVLCVSTIASSQSGTTNRMLKSQARNRRPLNWPLLDSKLLLEIGQARQRWGRSPE